MTPHRLLTYLCIACAFAVSALLFAPNAIAQPSRTQQFAGQTIDRVQAIEAETGLPIQAEIEVPLHAVVSRSLLRDLTESLLTSGDWSDVQLDLRRDNGELLLLVTLAPRHRVYRIDIDGEDALSESRISRAVRLNVGSVVDPRRLERAEASLRQEYLNSGYENVTITIQLRDTDRAPEKVLFIQIDEGEPTEISSVVIEGDAPPRRSRLLSFLALDEGDIYRPAATTESEVQGVERLKELGYLEARFDFQALRREGPARVAPVFNLRLGPRYEVRFEGIEAAPEVAREALLEQLQLGATPLRAPLTAHERRLETIFQRHGYANAAVQLLPVRPRNPTPGFDAVLLVRVELGSRLLVETHSFPGNRHFDEAFLQEQLEAALEEANDVGSPLGVVDDHDLDELLGGGDGTRRQVRPEPLEARGVWHEASMERATAHLQELYRAAGYLSAEVGPAVLVLRAESTEEDRDPNGAREAENAEHGHVRGDVQVPVSEGPRTRLHGVRLEGNASATDQEILIASQLERSQPFSYLALEHAEERITAEYQRRGLFYARVSSTLSFSANATRVQVTFHIEEGDEVRVEEVLVEGADQTRASLIRRVAGVRDGQLLTPALLREAQDRLLELGIFAGVHVTPLDPDVPAEAKSVVLTITERRTQSLDGSIGLSTAQGARGALEYSVRNIGGLGLEASARVQLGYQFFFIDSVLEDRYSDLRVLDKLERRIVLSLTAPYIGLRTVRASLSLSHIRENERNFGLDSNTLDLTFRYRPLRALTLSLSGGLENNEIEILGAQSYEQLLEETTDLRLRSLLRVPEGETTLVSANISATYDQRDSPFTPTRGFYATLGFEWARTVRDNVVESGGDEAIFSSHHFRLLFSASGYVPLGRSWVFATQLRFGRIIHLTQDSQSYPNRKFFLGGVDTVRGYLQDSLVPQDIADEICDPRTADCTLTTDFNPNAVVQGGDVFLSLRGELRFPIYSSLRGGVFVDFGNSWVNPSELSFRLRPSAGLGIRISTPVGPIAFDYGFLLNRRRFLGEPIGSFHFSIGLF